MSRAAAPHEVFSESWAIAWGEELRSSEDYGRAAATWEGSLALVMTAGDAQRSVLLDLWHGDCRAARVASADDLETADFVLAGDQATWQRVLAGEQDPIMGLMTGRLKLRRGSVAKLTPYMQASKELVKAAGRVPSFFRPSTSPEPDR